MKAKLKIFGLLMLFSYGLMLYLALLQTAPGQPLQFHADGPIWLTLQAALSLWLTRAIDSRYQRRLSHAQQDTNFSKAVVSAFTISMLLFVPLMVALQLIIDVSTQQPLLGQHYLRVGLMYLLVHSLVAGSYLFWRGLQWQQTQQLLLLGTEQKLQQYKLQLLQQQLDPHFLFNNLNVLSVLIHKNADQAEQFLESFAEIYRYQLQQSSKPLVVLQEELQFGEQYMILLAQRFPNSYPLHQTISAEQAAQYSVVPCALQLLLENAVKHNSASPTSPLNIEVALQHGYLVVRHELRLKAFAQPGTGSGLSNLMARCLAQTGKPILIEQNHEFTVKVPLQINA